jgi:TPP-dependent pyruvate/acetoin dehydrogenase alpha subunit
MPGVQVDGNDVLAVRDATAHAVQRARSGAGPTMLEALTYRFVGHSRADPAAYRPQGELERWLARDPIARSAERLRLAGMADSVITAIRDEATRRVSAASQEARKWPPPVPEALHTQVYA